jgi:signal transduction histidine kinase
MKSRSSSSKDRFTRLIVFAIIAVATGFVLMALAIQRASREIDELSDSIARNSSQSIERLASLRASTIEVELALSGRLLDENSAIAHPEADLDQSLGAVERAVKDYLRLPRFSGEEKHWLEVKQAWLRFDESSRRNRELLDAKDARSPRSWFTNVVEPNAARLLGAAMRAIEFNAEKGKELASKIKATRARTTFLTYGLATSCVVLGLAATLLVHLRSRERRALDQAHAEVLEARSAELEQFAERVAHDIRGPLSAARMAGELCLARSADEAVSKLVTRMIRNLSRADAITTGLLEFARAGARPDPGARTDVREAINDLENALAPEAELARIAVRFEPAPSAFVACSMGVYLSLVGNIARNAIKYMHESTVRRIVVSVVDQGSVVRTEVSDSGPGIREADQASLFELYFRGRHPGTQGFGLGLATVKKLVDGHRGRVGVISALGKGSTFWFELPKASIAEEASSREEPSQPIHVEPAH